METLRTTASRKLYKSYAQKPPLARSKATALTTTFIRVSFLEIEDCWVLAMMVSVSRLRALSNGGCHLEQFGTQCQARALGCGQVDLEADSIFFHNKLDHALTLRELRDITDCQDCILVQCLHDFIEPVRLR